MSSVTEVAPAVAAATYPYFTEEHDMFRETVKQFVQTEIAPHAEEWDDITLEQWHRENVHNDDVLHFLTSEARVNFTAEPWQLSFLYFLFYLRSGDNFTMLASYDNGAQMYVVPESMHQVAAAIGTSSTDRPHSSSPVHRNGSRGPWVIEGP